MILGLSLFASLLAFVLLRGFLASLVIAVMVRFLDIVAFFVVVCTPLHLAVNVFLSVFH